MNASTVEERLADLEKQFAELRATVLNLTPKPKDWRAVVGTMQDDEMSRHADALGREWRQRADEE